MTPQPTAPHGDGPARDRVAVDVDALEHAVSRLEPVAGALRLGSTRLVHATTDPGEPPAGDHVLDLQEAASDALLALSRGLEESAALLTRVARRYAELEAEAARALGGAGAAGSGGGA